MAINPLVLQGGTIVAAAALAWGVNSSQVGALNEKTKDHEIRLRVVESRILEELGNIKGDIKSEFHGLKLRVTSLEKAIDKAGRP